MSCVDLAKDVTTRRSVLVLPVGVDSVVLREDDVGNVPLLMAAMDIVNGWTLRVQDGNAIKGIISPDGYDAAMKIVDFRAMTSTSEVANAMQEHLADIRHLASKHYAGSTLADVDEDTISLAKRMFGFTNTSKTDKKVHRDSEGPKFPAPSRMGLCGIALLPRGKYCCNNKNFSKHAEERFGVSIYASKPVVACKQPDAEHVLERIRSMAVESDVFGLLLGCPHRYAKFRNYALAGFLEAAAKPIFDVLDFSTRVTALEDFESKRVSMRKDGVFEAVAEAAEAHRYKDAYQPSKAAAKRNLSDKEVEAFEAFGRRFKSPAPAPQTSHDKTSTTISDTHPSTALTPSLKRAGAESDSPEAKRPAHDLRGLDSNDRALFDL